MSGRGDGDHASQDSSEDDDEEESREDVKDEDGNIIPADFGHFPEQRLTFVGNNWSNYLKPGFKRHVLYWWHLLDIRDILQSALSKFPMAIEASGQEAPCTSTSQLQHSHARDKRKTKKMITVLGRKHLAPCAQLHWLHTNQI
jgi:hypothetical protein